MQHVFSSPSKEIPNVCHFGRLNSDSFYSSSSYLENRACFIERAQKYKYGESQQADFRQCPRHMCWPLENQPFSWLRNFTADYAVLADSPPEN